MSKEDEGERKTSERVQQEGEKEWEDGTDNTHASVGTHNTPGHINLWKQASKNPPDPLEAT